METMKQLNQLLEDINEKLSAKGEDGKVISITEVMKQFPDLSAKYSDLETRLQDIETRTKSRKWAGDVPGLEDEKEKFSLVRAINAIRTGNWKNAGFEAEVFKHTRDMSTGDDSAGGYIVPAQAMPEFIEMLRDEAVVIRMGARMIELSGAPVTFPRQTGGATAYWVGENEEITASQLAFGQLKMTPKKVAALTKLSNELLGMSSPSVEGMIRQDFAQALGLAIDLAALRGSGSENEPLGIANTPGINTYAMGTNGAVPDFVTPWPDMQYELAVDGALRGNLGYVFHPAIKRVLQKIRVPQYSGDTSGDYPMLPLSDAALTAIVGFRFDESTQLPINLTKGSSSNCSEIYFANWSELLIGQWKGFEILASNVAGTAFAFDQTWIRIIAQVDVGLRHVESFCLVNDAKIA